MPRLLELYNSLGLALAPSPIFTPEEKKVADDIIAALADRQVSLLSEKEQVVEIALAIVAKAAEEKKIDPSPQTMKKIMGLATGRITEYTVKSG